MKISVDGGALNQKDRNRFGTAVFSESLVKALHLYDKINKYYIYTFENLKPKVFWMKGRVSFEELRQNKDVFLALNQALPLYASGKIISFCHGLSYYFFPQYYSKKDVVRLNKQLREMIKKSEKIIVSSEKVKTELISIDRSIENKIVKLPFGIPFDMSSFATSFAKASKVKKATTDKEKYFLFVGMNHPIKNIDFIKKSFAEFKKDKNFKDYELKILTNNISRKSLKNYYQHATALLTASYYESFNFPVLEALSQGCPVVGLKSAIIPELEPNVNVANDTKDFVKKMKTLKIKPTVQSINRLFTDFNWKNYVKNLVDLY
jgi:glycosyltransferase involved in cell wall biosynthesis